MRAEGGHIFNNTVLDHNGAVVCLNVALDYMFSQAASTALRGENWPDSFRGKPYIFFVVVCFGIIHPTCCIPWKLEMQNKEKVNLIDGCQV